MMHNYKVNNTNSVFTIQEVNTGLTIASYHNKDRAVRAKRSLNKGSGFNGFTPPFFAANTFPEIAREVHAYKRVD